MLQRLLSAVLAGGLLLLTGSTAFAYYSGDSYEADVTFTGTVERASVADVDLPQSASSRSSSARSDRRAAEGPAKRTLPFSST
jgi:hypothetical protein